MPEELKKKKAQLTVFMAVFFMGVGEKHNISGLKKENLVVISVDL